MNHKIESRSSIRKLHFRFFSCALLCAAILSFSSCRGDNQSRGTVIDAADGKPIPGVAIYMRTSEGTPFDRNQSYYIANTNQKGEYTLGSPKGRLEEIVAIAEGYYPNITKKRCALKLQKIGDRPITFERKELRVNKNDGNIGYCFAGNSVTLNGEHDIAIVKKGDKYLITTSGNGGVQRKDVAVEGFSGMWCEFFNALTAPREGYAHETELEGLVYVRCRDGKHYAKLFPVRRTEMASGDVSCDIYYAYQPDIDSNALKTICERRFFENNCLMIAPKTITQGEN